MSPRTALRRASGVLATLALAAVALVWAPSAAVAATSSGCAYYNGLTVTATQVTTNGLSFNAGEVIQTSVTAKGGIAWTNEMTFSWADITPGGFVIPTNGTYNIQYYTEPAQQVTWKFTCGGGSTGGTTPPVVTADADKDGVIDSVDRCASTTIPDRFSKPVAGRYGINSLKKFVDGAGVASAYTITETKGCSAAQIIAARKLKGTDQRSGITLATLQGWVTSVR